MHETFQRYAWYRTPRLILGPTACIARRIAVLGNQTSRRSGEQISRLAASPAGGRRHYCPSKGCRRELQAAGSQVAAQCPVNSPFADNFPRCLRPVPIRSNCARYAMRHQILRFGRMPCAVTAGRESCPPRIGHQAPGDRQVRDASAAAKKGGRYSPRILPVERAPSMGGESAGGKPFQVKFQYARHWLHVMNRTSRHVEPMTGYQLICRSRAA